MIDHIIADLIIRNASVFTVDKDDRMAQAVAVKGKTILAVGTEEEVLAFQGTETTIIDAAGASVLPGFIDTHIHFLMYGLLDNGIINVAHPRVHSITDIQELIRQEAARKQPGEWIKLNGYDHNKLAEGRHPTRQELDEAAPDHPVQLTRCCAHMAVYNSKAIEAADIGDGSAYAPDEVVRNEDGSLHGLLKETAHMDTSTRVEFSQAELLGGLQNADHIMAENGITSIHDAGSYGGVSTSEMQEACRKGLIHTRIRPMIFDMFGKESGKKYIRDFIATGIHTGCGDEHFKIGPTKIMLDGSSSGPSCAVIDGYSHDPQNHGIQVWQQDEADEIVMEAHCAGFQVTAHAVGDKAVTIMLNAIEKAQKAYPRTDCRHRIEHCGITNPELIRRIAELGVIPISNPSFITINGSDYNRYYGDRVNYLFALRSYLNHGIITAIGSDAPVTHPNPMNSFFAALNRKDIKTRDNVGSGQKVTVKELVRMFTYNGAYVSFEEDIKGSLEPGKLADIVILDQDLLTYDPENITDVKVKYTLIDGQIVYQA